MSRIPVIPPQELNDSSRTLFEKIQKTVGKVPNAYALIGSYSPASLALLLEGDALLSKGQLSRSEIESVRIAVSELNGCDYCVAAHVAIGKMVGLNEHEIRGVRNGEQTGNLQRDALIQFSKQVAGSRGLVDESVLKAVLEAGYSPSQVIEVLLVIALITFTNLVNRVNDTTIDFPKPI